MLLARLSSANCLQAFCEPASEEASFWDDGHANRLVAVCGVWSEHWQADLPLLQPLKQCWQHSCICFLKPASAPDAQHKDSTSLIDPCGPVLSETRLGKPLYDSGHCTVTQFQAVYRTSYRLGHLCGEQQSNSQILREFFAMRCHVEYPVVQYERIVLKAPNLNCSKTRYTNLYGPVKQTKTWTWWIGHVALHG